MSLHTFSPMNPVETFSVLSIGSALPDLTLSAYDPKTDQEAKFQTSDFRGKWLVFFFYPADFTFICPTELEELAGHYEEFQKAGAEILSVSTDTVFVHKAWHDHSKAIRKIRFPMIADPTGTLCKRFGTYLPHEGLSLRGTFVIDPDGILKTLEIHDNSIGRSAKELLRKLQAAQFVRDHGGVEVCPASWEPGKRGLKPGMDLVGKL